VTRKSPPWLRQTGLFERIGALREAEVLADDFVEQNYGDRIHNLVVNDVVYWEKLVERADDWRSFIRLWERVESARQRRLGEPLSKRTDDRRRDEQRWRESERLP
jgi:hypothetical protein